MDELMIDSTLRVNLIEKDDSVLTFSFVIEGPPLTWRERLHRKIFVQLYSEPGNHPVHVPDVHKNEPYKNDEGEFDYSMGLRKDKMQLAVPYEYLPEVKFGDLITARISLENSATGAILGLERLSLIGTEKGTLVENSVELMESYLTSGLDEKEQIEKTWYWMELNAERKPLLEQGIGFLKEIAGKGSADAAMKLHELYEGGRLVPIDHGEARKWLQHAEKIKRNELIPGGAAGKEQIPDKIVDEDSLKKCEQLARAGYPEAKWLIYLFSLSPQGKSYNRDTAFNWLKSAAADGVQRAVRSLADAYRKHYGFISRTDAEDYLAVLKKAADTKQPLAEYYLYQIYSDGDCLGQPLGKNEKQAYDMLREASEDGSVEAAYELWHAYEDGNRFLEEEKAALKWLAIAAEREFPPAEERLGDLYLDGKGVKQDSAQGLELLKKAADHQNWDAQLKLYQGYSRGFYKNIFFDKDQAQADVLLRKYAEDGNPKACLLIADKYEQGNSMVMEHREVFHYLAIAAKEDYAPAKFRMANILLDGYYVREDREKAKQLLNEAAASGLPEAQFALYRYYTTGYKSISASGVNRERAVRWLLKAAQKLPEAQYEVWALRNDGQSASMDVTQEQSMDFLFRSASMNFSPALYRVGMAFGTGTGVDKNPERGIRLIEKAAALHNPEAMYTLAELKTKGTFEGASVKQDSEEGMHLLLLSAELGYAPACERIKKFYEAGDLPGESEVWLKTIFRNLPASERKNLNLSSGDAEAAAGKSETE
ncbi:tetratricopeptide repeat protein [Sporolactobacillus vineae]|uniref:tetratricopeptide repeat protein n=1 Tax=Sporolactobacillus vineae TaxID=444463 RepID=UPI0002894B3C|nr:SEL1-like repeat protein [Sporolactobacillus vineae]